MFRNPQIANLLPTGHKIGKPVPLFTKIEPERVEELKNKFAGKQQSSKDSSPIRDGDSSVSIETLTEAVTKQVLYFHCASLMLIGIREFLGYTLYLFKADKVRALKSGKVDKSIWQPEVKILLNLKKQLEIVKKHSTDNAENNIALNSVTNNVGNNAESIDGVEEVKQSQGEVDKEVFIIYLSPLFKNEVGLCQERSF